jgi:hypothetical protein
MGELCEDLLGGDEGGHRLLAGCSMPPDPSGGAATPPWESHQLR